MSENISLSAADTFDAYLAKPDQGEPKGAVIVIHEVWGLDGHIKSVADRVAKEGYVALAPDLLSRTLDIPRLRNLQLGLFDPEKRNEVQPELRRLMSPMQDPEVGKATISNLRECFRYLYDMPECGQKIFVMGFCFGGTYSFELAVSEPRLSAAAVFYGHCDHEAGTLKNIGCPVVAFYGENDERLMSALPALKDRMADAGVDFTATVYPDCGHAFFNDTNKYAFNAEAAEDSWQRTLQLFNSLSSRS